MRRRVLIITQWFDPEPTFKGLVFCQELHRQGFEVDVITGFPNYPGGKLYPGYRIKLIKKEEIGGVRVTRVPLFPSHNKSALGRVLNYVSFAASSVFYGVFIARRPDVIYVYHPPLTVAIVATIIRICRKIPVVCDIQDMWPDTLRATGMISNAKILNLVGRVCNWVYNHVDHIVVLSPGFKRLLLERGVANSKVEVIYNWCAEHPVNKADINTPKNFPVEGVRILFAGNMGNAQALSAVLEAAKIVFLEAPHVKIVFLGQGIQLEKLKQKTIQDHIENVTFLPAVSMSEVGAYLNAADACLVHLKKDPLFDITIPSKTQAYLSAGKPIIMAVQGDAANLIRQADCGFIAEPEDPKSIADAILSFSRLSKKEKKEMGEKSKEFYAENLAMKKGVTSFCVVFKRLISLRK